MDERKLWIVEEKVTDSFVPVECHWKRDDARDSAREIRENGNQVRVKKYIPEECVRAITYDDPDDFYMD